MLPHYSNIFEPAVDSADKSWIVDGKIYIDPKREAFMNIAKTIKDKRYTKDLEFRFSEIGGEEGKNTLLGGQNPFEIYGNIGEEKPNDNLCPYDEFMNSYWHLHADEYIEGKKKEQVIKDFKKEIKEQFGDKIGIK